MLLNSETASLLAHRVNNYLATLNIASELIVEDDASDLKPVLQSTVRDLSKFWQYVNFLFRNKELTIRLDDYLSSNHNFDLPPKLLEVFTYELFSGGLKNGATSFELSFNQNEDVKTLMYTDNGPGLSEQVMLEFGSIQSGGKNNCGLGLIVLEKLAKNYGFKLVLGQKIVVLEQI